MNADVADIVDVTPTLLDLAHVTPDTSKEPIDGISIAGVFKGQKIERNAPLFFEHYGARGILDGRWKLVSIAPEGPGNKRTTYRPWHLYDIANDPTEMPDQIGRGSRRGRG